MAMTFASAVPVEYQKYVPGSNDQFKNLVSDGPYKVSQYNPGKLIMMTRQGFVTHAEAEKSFRLSATEVLPRLADLEPLEEPVLAARA